MKRMIRLIAVVSAVSLIGTFTSGSMRPVSYTHLDVYKRQEVNCAKSRFLDIK